MHNVKLGCWTHCLQRLGHDLRAVVDCEHDVRYAGSSKSFDLVLDHGLIGELDQRLRVCEGLGRPLVGPLLSIVVGVGQETYERTQTGAEAADENDGCTAC